MFTGLIEECGTLLNFSAKHQLTIAAHTVLEGLTPGDSIAVNGVCLTVVSFTTQSFAADVMPEILRRSNLGELHAGNHVNLERALAANGRIGGHFVSGHIDGTGSLQSIQCENNALLFSICAAPSILQGIVEKGSIAVEGISLTVTTVREDSFSISVIPHTAAVTTLAEKRPGDKLNLETDILGKYVLRALSR